MESDARDKRILELSEELEKLYTERAGTMADECMGWCVLCGRNQVNTCDGFDTCADCQNRE